MKRYRVKKGEGYNGCEPITIYWVQVHQDGFLGGEWHNVKGFEDRQKAYDLVEILEG